MLKHVTQAAALAALCISLAACSGGSSNSRIDYGEVKELDGLDVPPDLTLPENTGLEEIPEIGLGAGPEGESDGVRVLPTSQSIRIERDGSLRWLRVERPAGELWPKLRNFWPTIGLSVAVDSSATGIMETDWAENHADAASGFLADMVKKVFKNAYSADTRDKYRLRVEPQDDGSSELFITHYGLKEVIATQVEEVVETAWEVRPSDPELANEVMNRLVLYLGGDEATAKAVVATSAPNEPPRAHLVGDEVVVSEGFSRTWRRTGIALDRLGLVIDDRNRSQGIYYISKIDLMKGVEEEESGGWFSGLFSSDEKESGPVKRQIQIQGGDTESRIRVLDESGNPDSSPLAVEILKRLQESLK